jgi:hypothetical protein
VIICFANFVRCKMSIILSHTYTLMAFFVLAELSEKTSWIRKVADNVRNQLCATEEFDEQSLSEVWTPFLDVLVEASTDDRTPSKQQNHRLDQKSMTLATTPSASTNPDSPQSQVAPTSRAPHNNLFPLTGFRHAAK